jgi:hypothetical protein
MGGISYTDHIEGNSSKRTLTKNSDSEQLVNTVPSRINGHSNQLDYAGIGVALGGGGENFSTPSRMPYLRGSETGSVFITDFGATDLFLAGVVYTRERPFLTFSNVLRLSKSI